MGRNGVEMLIDAICRRSVMHADAIGLPLAQAELEYVYERVGQHFIRERVTDKAMPDMAVLIDFISGKQGEE